MDNNTPQPINNPQPTTSKRGFNFANVKVKTVLIIIVLVIAVIGIFTLLQRFLAGPSQIVMRADELTNNGQYDEAQQILKEEYEKDKTDKQILAKLISTIAVEGNQKGTEKQSLEEAKPYIEQALAVGGNDPAILQSVGYAYESSGEYQKAFEYFDQTSKLAPGSAQAWFHRGHTQEFLGKRQEAWKDYEKAYQLDPNNTLILMARGNMLLSQSKPQESYESFKKASEQPGISNAAKAEALTGASIVRASQEDFKYIKEATELSKQAVEVSPDFSPALAAHGWNVYLTAPDPKESIPILENAIKANPRISKNYIILSTVYRAVRDYENALKYGNQAIDAVNNDNTILSQSDRQVAKGNYLYELAKTSYLAGELTSYVPIINQAIILNPSLKQQLKEDFETRELFRNMSGNREFEALMT